VVQLVQGGWKKNCSGLRVLAGKEETSRFLRFRDRLTIPKSDLGARQNTQLGRKLIIFDKLHKNDTYLDKSSLKKAAQIRFLIPLRLHLLNQLKLPKIANFPRLVIALYSENHSINNLN
jgi:hypothetical protein